MKKGLLFLVFTLFTLTFSLSNFTLVVRAGGTYPAGCERGIPTCPAGVDYVPDFKCVLARTIGTPSAADEARVVCCPNKCQGEDDTTDAEVQSVIEEYEEFQFFNSWVYISPEKIPAMVNLAISAVIGLLGIYALVRGLYVAAIKRPNAITSDQIAAVNKEFMNLILGFALTFTAIFAVQLVASLFGASITDLTIVTNPSEIEGTGPRIVVS